MCTRYPIINRVLELKVHIELTHFVQPGKIEIDANERTVNENLKTVFSFAPYSILSLTIYTLFFLQKILPQHLSLTIKFYYS